MRVLILLLSLLAVPQSAKSGAHNAYMDSIEAQVKLPA